MLDLCLIDGLESLFFASSGDVHRCSLAIQDRGEFLAYTCIAAGDNVNATVLVR